MVKSHNRKRPDGLAEFEVLQRKINMTILFFLYGMFNRNIGVLGFAFGIVCGLATDAFILALLALLK